MRYIFPMYHIWRHCSVNLVPPPQSNTEELAAWNEFETGHHGEIGSIS